VIVVVEGPSGAGKTTWCRTHGGSHALLESLPDGSIVPEDEEAAARFWVERNVARWAEVHARHERDGLVVVDTDPFKLHFTWSLYQIGYTTRRGWELMRDVARDAFVAGRYGLADLIYVSDVDEATLRARRDGDPTRTRRNRRNKVRTYPPAALFVGAFRGGEPVSPCDLAGQGVIILMLLNNHFPETISAR